MINAISRYLIAGSALMIAGTASAAPLVPPADTQANIVLVSGGCGPAFHRTPFGACVANRVFVPGYYAPVRLPPPCPRGYHRDPDPLRRLCYPNF